MRTHCENCATPLEGRFCSKCGQSAAEYNVPVGSFAKEFVSESFDLDSRLRLTLGPLFLKPGAVPRDYVSGLRARFVPPVRLYIIASFAMFLTMSFGDGLNWSAELDLGGQTEQEFSSEAESGSDDAGSRADAESSGDDAGSRAVLAPGSDPETETPATGADAIGDALEHRVESTLAEAFGRVRENPEAVSDVFLNRMAQAMFLLLPVFALLLKIFYRKRLYVEHLVFAIYFHSFVFLLMAFLVLPEALGLVGVARVTELGVLWMPAYLYLALRRFYDESRVRTFVKFVALSFLYLNVGGLTLLAVLLLALTTA